MLWITSSFQNVHSTTVSPLLGTRITVCTSTMRTRLRANKERTVHTHGHPILWLLRYCTNRHVYTVPFVLYVAPFFTLCYVSQMEYRVQIILWSALSDYRDNTKYVLQTRGVCVGHRNMRLRYQKHTNLHLYWRAVAVPWPSRGVVGMCTTWGEKIPDCIPWIWVNENRSGGALTYLRYVLHTTVQNPVCVSSLHV